MSINEIDGNLNEITDNGPFSDVVLVQLMRTSDAGSYKQFWCVGLLIAGPGFQVRADQSEMTHSVAMVATFENTLQVCLTFERGQKFVHEPTAVQVSQVVFQWRWF